MQEAGITVRHRGCGRSLTCWKSCVPGKFAGGEPNPGHIVMPSLGTTGDRIVTGLKPMSRMAQTRKSLAELASRHAGAPSGVDQRQGRRQGNGRQKHRLSVRTVAAAEAELGIPGASCCDRRYRADGACHG